MNPGERRLQAAAAATGLPPAGARCAGGGGSAALCLLLSLTSLGACLLLSAKTCELQGRVAALEERGSPGWAAGAPLSPGPLLALLQPHMEQLFQEKLGEGLAKLRTVREAPSECVCPPGPPGRRGKPGRRGEPGPAVSTVDFTLGSTKLRQFFFPFLYHFTRTAFFGRGVYGRKIGTRCCFFSPSLPLLIVDK
ncbi:collagen alpha-1(XXIII) chain-like [Chrysemys picta bellii]|uniref:collagen alpha-1(XXIII) chain-like n=1 Tax=Chrysemys picta bellii TaxID=8478 RepID=UPI0032B2AE53